MQEKVMVNDALASVKGSLSVYATTISECENQNLRSTIQGIRDSCETSQYELFRIAEQKGFYQPAQQASPEDVQQVRTSLEGAQQQGQQQGQGMPQGTPQGMPQGQGIPQTPQSQGSMGQPQGLNKPQGQGLPQGSVSPSQMNIPSTPQSYGMSQGSMSGLQGQGMQQSSMGQPQGLNKPQGQGLPQGSVSPSQMNIPSTPQSYGMSQGSMSVQSIPQAVNSIGEPQGIQQSHMRSPIQ